MLKLSTAPRTERGRKTGTMRKAGSIPAVLYGPVLSTLSLSVGEKEFEKVYQEVGSSSLLNLGTEEKTIPVLIREVQRDPVSSKVIHVDFYQPPLDKKIEVTIPIVFEGEAPAVKDFGGTLIKNIQEVQVRAFPQNLPHEIKVQVVGLTTFEHKILVKDLFQGEGVEILAKPEDIVAQVVPPEKVEEELAKPVEEKVEDVAKVEKPKKEEAAEQPKK
ncbi:MAG: large subunit ribosomal protein L25 [Parcubacteria group bacterium Greene0714_21]|nr:MAG: large subunit ribosomal protein L25 [Parcubacteria group bacterium Greene0416_39]TSC97951.1 MAG: large subunit ribosomal protein L25 [Parcubacteria group bacterium Greene1014_47]TSD04532.1 MAG: large subunit ribosomal protein L25 [Parcubacteria group bacterium Greene0714_21]